MEWNTARLKFAFLSAAPEASPQSTAPKLSAPILGTAELGQLCKIGFALTWPLLVLGLGILLVLLLRH
jgi:hypothetical protein